MTSLAPEDIEEPANESSPPLLHWLRPHRNISSADIAHYSSLKQRGNDDALTRVLGLVDARVMGLDLLAPGGREPELFVRMRDDPALLPISVSGDGFQRCVELGLGLVASPSSVLLVDEFDNGLHHTVLEPIWRWLAEESRARGIQVFATTHSEECLEAASRAFASTNDDGLRVIRLDRRGSGDVAVVYDAHLAAASIENGLEIRG